MADVLTPAQRTYNMSMIRSRNTGPEMQLRNLLISRRLSDFEMQPQEIPGRPDFYFSNRRVVLFVDGCFWHGCKTCFQTPQTNRKFWSSKISSNIVRDGAVDKILGVRGITVIRIKEHELKRNLDKVLIGIKQKLQKDYQPKVLDLFAGAGGFSEGFLAAGFDVIGHIEMNKDACETLKTRLIYYALKKRRKLNDYKKYLLGELSKEEIIAKYGLQKEVKSIINVTIRKDNYKELIGDVKKKLDGEKLDIIIGGPPCQAYSYIGRARDKNRMRRDARNYLYKHYVEFLKALKPKLFIFENVPGLLTAGGGRHFKNMQKIIKQVGYTMDYKLLNAADFGVPQNRKRLIIIGWNGKSKLKQYPEFKKIEKEYLVKDFLNDLPRMNAGEQARVQGYKIKSAILENLGIMDKEIGLLVAHIARPHSKRDLKIYKLAVLYKNEGKNIKYNQLPKKLKSHKNEKGFLDRFKVVDDLSPESHTIVAHIAKDGNYYIHPDIRQNRSLTVREAARLQTFPDNFKFEGSRTSQFRQIGNAVPPIFAYHIAKVIKNNLNRV